MREIKFRAWDCEKKEMIYQHPCDSSHRYMTWNGNVYREGKLQSYIMSQYTGFKDDCDTEIYEYDLITYSEFYDGDYLTSGGQGW